MRTSFSENPEEFLKQLGEYVTLSKRADIDKVYKDFALRFRTLNEKEVPRVMATCNTMLINKLNAIPYYMSYMQSVVAIEPATKDVSRLEQWSDVVDSMFKDVQNRRFENVRQYLDFSKDFLDKNALFFGDLNINWFSNSHDYSFKYEKGTPSVEWQKTNLSARFKTDSIQIFDTKGAYFPITMQWKGAGGKVTWGRFKDADTYCILNDFVIEMSKGFYRAEKAKLHYPLMFSDRDLDGHFEDKLTVKNEKIEGSYPRFESFDKNLKINNLGGSIQFEGGFKLQGTTVIGYGTSDQKARLTMNDKKRGTRNFRAAAENFLIRKGENVIGEQVESVIYFGKDSIYHPSVNLKIDIIKDQLVIERGQRGSDRNPFFNSYTQMNIDVGKIKWNIEKDSIIIGDKYQVLA